MILSLLLFSCLSQLSLFESKASHEHSVDSHHGQNTQINGRSTSESADKAKGVCYLQDKVIILQNNTPP